MMLSTVCGVQSTPWWAWLILGPVILLAVCALVGALLS
jgi:hypothetical protein